MRALLIILAALCMGSLRAQPEPAPDFALKSVSGENLRLSEYRGQVVLVVFWASWCPECPQLLDDLQDLYAETGGKGLEILAISVDYLDARSARAAAGATISYPILLDVKRDVVKSYQIEKMPGVVVVDRDGRITAKNLGPAALKADYRAVIAALLDR